MQVAKCYSALASVYRDSNKLHLAIRACASFLACLDGMNVKELTTILTKYKQCLNLHNATPLAVCRTAVTDYKNSHFQGALCQLQYCLAKWQEIPESNSEIASCYSTMASCQRELGLFDSALLSCDEALKFCVDDPVKLQVIMVKKESLSKHCPTPTPIF